MKKVRASGFTLIEMMVVVAITSILLLIGIPSMRYLIERNAVANQVNTLIGAITFARAEAIKRGAPIVLCRSEDAETAETPSCAGTGDWKSGWIVFLDRDGDDGLDPEKGDVLLRVQGAFPDSGGIEQNQFKKLKFRNTGLMSSGASQFTFQSASSTAAQQRRVCISIVGRTRLIDNSTDTCSS